MDREKKRIELEKRQTEFVKMVNTLRGEIISLNCVVDIYSSQAVAQYFCTTNKIKNKKKCMEIIALIHNIRDSRYKRTLLKKALSTSPRFKQEHPNLLKQMEASNEIRNYLAHGVIITPKKISKKGVHEVEFFNAESILTKQPEHKIYPLQVLQTELGRLQSQLQAIDGLRNWFIHPY